MKYTYEDIKDKSKEGLDKELNDGLVKIAVYFQTTLGIPKDIFENDLIGKLESKADLWLFYMNFRNANPEVFK